MVLPGLEREIRIEIAGRSDVGRRRSENQDAFCLSDLESTDGGPPRSVFGQGSSVVADPWAFTLGHRGALLAVADGMGGAAMGALASRLALESLFTSFSRLWLGERMGTPGKFATSLREAVEEANARVFEESRLPDREGMGTTMTALGLYGSLAFVGQVGDSRAYLCRGGTATQLTRDQSVVQQLVEAGELTEEEAGRSEKRSVLLQAMGVAEEVSVALTWQEIRRGDAVLLCSDGLHGLVGREEIAERLADGRDPAAASEALVDLANERGGPDNITVLVARFGGDGLTEATEDDEVLPAMPYEG